MIHIHPFPARMAPEIALKGLENLPKEHVILDPMAGSGMVLGTAAKLGLQSVGYDLDPLACLISRANANRVDEKKVWAATDKLLSQCATLSEQSIYLPWMDGDSETLQYVNFWFAPKQIAQLRCLSFLLIAQPIFSNPRIIDVLKVAVSRLIVTKEPKASLARDTAHSRPHRTILKNDFDIWAALSKSVNHVLTALQPEKIKENAKIYRGDARKMGRVRDSSIDCIVTSPPYLNAIDYMRGHRLSLVWMGYSVSKLRKIRTRSVGAEVVDHQRTDIDIEDFLSALHSDVGVKKKKILRRYYKDLCSLTQEAFRTLKSGRTATYVIGNSTIRGHEIRNSDLLRKAAFRAGFYIKDSEVRSIPENRRYMPLLNDNKSSLSNRMRKEHVLVFEKVH